MLRKREAILKQLNLAIDIIIVVSSFYITYFIRAHIPHLPSIEGFERFAWYLLIILPLWVVIFNLRGEYSVRRLYRISDIFLRIIKNAFIVIISLIFIFYLLKAPYISRTLIIGFGIINSLLMFGKETLAREYMKRIRKSESGTKNVVILGDADQVKKLNAVIKKNPPLGLDVIGYISFAAGPHEPEETGLKMFGKTERLKYVLHAHPVDILLIGLPRERHAEIDELLLICEEQGVEVWVAADMFHATIAKTSVDVLENIPVLIFRTTPELSWELLLKRLMDMVLSFLGLIVLSPLLLIIAIAIKFTSDGPVLFKQKRVCLHGRRFIMYKFRSMVTNAEQRREELQRLNIMKGPVFKVKHDPRITTIGHFLRKTSLDELPQLWNVLLGDMSLVGPRPPLPTEVDMYKGWQRRRLSVKPGITCLWQISGRNKIIDFNKWVQLDLKYVDNWSLWLDIKILFKTIPVVIFERGAE